ncbi:MAG: NUDIX hydrolase [Sandaracinaceae bacterium]
MRAPVLLALAALGCGDGESPLALGPTTPPPSVARIGDPPTPFEGLEGFLVESRGQAILASTQTLRLEAPLDSLRAGERACLASLLEVGEIVQRLYELQLHPEAARVRAHLLTYAPRDPGEEARLATLRDLFTLFRGVVVVDPELGRMPLAPVRPEAPGGALYPPDVDEEIVRAFAEAHPRTAVGDLLGPRTVVRRRTEEALADDLSTLEHHPALEALHPQLRRMLSRPADREELYAVPYALAYARELTRAYRRLRSAARDARRSDGDLADYLEQRARDLLSNDYEAGDAAWVSGAMRRLNAEIGAYETYDDRLLGVKAHFALSILVRAPEATDALDRIVARLPELQAQLPGGPDGAVRRRIPIGLYDVVADFGQARGANTATVLPNEERIVRRYGRTVLLRRNVIQHPARMAIQRRRFAAVMAPAHLSDLTPTGELLRTALHELGHDLGPRTTVTATPVSLAMGPLHNTLEELKADLIALWLGARLRRLGVLSAAEARQVQASGVLRVLLSRAPERREAYGTMELMQQRFFLAQGLLDRDDDGRVHVRQRRMEATVEAMLAEVLAVQRGGDRAAAEALIDRWAVWDDEVQGELARRLAPASPRRIFVRYAILDDLWSRE